MVHPVFIQAGYYGIVMVLTVLLLSFLERGFFWKYLRVRLSFGRLVLCKVRAINRDYFRTGQIIEGFLVYKSKEGNKRIKLDKSDVFYRVMGTSWIDIDEEKNAICKVDYDSIEGFDAIKYNNLFLRALYKPSIAEPKDKIIIGGIIIIGIVLLVVAYLVYKNSGEILLIKEAVNNLNVGEIIPGVGL